MEKSVGTREYQVFLSLLREKRQAAGLTQVELAARIEETQSFVSKVERGELRLDFLQLRTICLAMGTEVVTLAGEFERRIKGQFGD